MNMNAYGRAEHFNLQHKVHGHLNLGNLSVFNLQIFYYAIYWEKLIPPSKVNDIELSAVNDNIIVHFMVSITPGPKYNEF